MFGNLHPCTALSPGRVFAIKKESGHSWPQLPSSNRASGEIPHKRRMGKGAQIMGLEWNSQRGERAGKLEGRWAGAGEKWGLDWETYYCRHRGAEASASECGTANQTRTATVSVAASEYEQLRTSRCNSLVKVDFVPALQYCSLRSRRRGRRQSVCGCVKSALWRAHLQIQGAYARSAILSHGFQPGAYRSRSRGNPAPVLIPSLCA